MLKYYFFALCILLIAPNCYSQLDTVIVQLNSTDCSKQSPVYYGRSDLSPFRMSYAQVSLKAKKGTLISEGGSITDSIHVCSQSIQVDSLDYYLIVYSFDNIILFEGQYFSEFANGKVIKYDQYGRKIFEGNYECIKAKRKRMYARPYGVHRIYSYKNRKVTHPTQIKELEYLKKARKYILRLIDENNEIISENVHKR